MAGDAPRRSVLEEDIAELDEKRRRLTSAVERAALDYPAAQLERRLGRFSEARARVERALDSLPPKGSGAARIEAVLRMTLADLLLRRGERDAADAELSRVRVLTAKMPLEPGDQAYLFIVAGHRARRYSRLEDVDREYARALKLYEAAKDSDGVAYARMCLGQTAIEQARVAVAKAHFERALRDGGPEMSPHTRMMLLGNIAHVNLVTGQVRRAEEILQEACALAEQVGDRINLSTNLFNHAYALLDLGRSEEALGVIDQAEDLVKGQGERWNLMFTHSGRARAFSRLGRFAEAEAELQEALRVSEEQKSCDGIAAAHHVAAAVAMRQGRWPEARKHLQESDRQEQLGGRVIGRIRLHVQWSAYARSQGATAEADERLETAMKLAKDAGIPDVIPALQRLPEFG